MRSSPPCRVGLVGCGRWGQHILRDLVSLGCEVIVVDSSQDSRRLALEAGAASVITTIADLSPVAGVVVATPTSTHAAVIEELQDRGVPIFSEKPLTADRASAARLAELAPARLFVMDKWRYHPGVEMLREIARSEELGPALGLRTTRVGWANPHSDVDPIWILAPHDLSIALEVFGNIPTPRAAIAERLNGTPTGLVGVLGSDPWMVLDVSILDPVRRREIRLHCRDGVAVLSDAYSDHIRVTRGFDSRPRAACAPELRPISTEPPMLRELRAFLRHVEGGPPPRSSAAEGAMIVNAVSDLRDLAGVETVKKETDLWPR